MENREYLLLEPASVCTIVTAVATAVFSAQRSYMFDTIAKRNRSLEQGVNTLESGTAMLVPIFGSITLMVLFFFFSSISFILTLSVCMSSAFGLGFCLFPLAERLLGLNANREIKVPCLGPYPLSIVCLVPIASAVVLCWLYTGHWTLNNVLGASLCVAVVTFVRFPNMKVAFILLAGLFVYDIFWVFYSAALFGKNVMVTVATEAAKNPVASMAEAFNLHAPPGMATELQLPVKLIFPHDLLGSLSWETPAGVRGGFMMLGLGDIAIPGMFLAYAYRFDFHVPRTGPIKYFPVAVVGYALGLIISLTMSLVYRMAQPALLYLVPCVTIPVLALGLYRKELKTLWSATLTSPADKDMADGPQQEERDSAV
mmetsp:Transcript_3802/g.5760  ORF Transcript_3802/g.5760 Transcript_3802/m.5760 type:complete len:370 (+) Transcript_3802:144-1253(+)|eukprot:CAMPEP_0184648944 /NCGR_PEP_ID=MMETSP0308-20130426/6204_1 /TAXON_ID=38269 /ORGANISM="Gloeochaete witrockiana, Strain SAG 46.84" /LENGTH=369 /DNA_ID=CAMNT_0027081271 /DNA_START=133 /DNA_END=1242 /DNA_ORIENTATION=+